jgi:hypothetical protein
MNSHLHLPKKQIEYSELPIIRTKKWRGMYVEQIDKDASGDNIAIYMKDNSTDVKTM